MINEKKLVLVQGDHINLNLISDQILFLEKKLRKKIPISKTPLKGYHNIYIEGSFKNLDYISRYKYSLILTEHMDFNTTFREILFHNKRIKEYDEYIHPLNKIKRVLGLCKLAYYAQNIYTLGDLPKMINFDQMFPGKKITALNYPKIKFVQKKKNKEYYFCFIGTETIYRRKIIEKLYNKFGKKKIFCSFKGDLNLDQRKKILNLSEFNLNIPQDENWKYPSNLRIYTSLLYGCNCLMIDNKSIKTGNLRNYYKFNLNFIINNFDYLKNKIKLKDSINKFNNLNS